MGNDAEAMLQPGAAGTAPRALRRRRPGVAGILLLLMAAAILMQVELVFSKSINWDEFFHFSLILRHLQGRPVQWLQTPFVWLFPWVASVPGDNIDHIQLIRLLLLPFELAAVAAIVAAARGFTGLEEALFCGLLYITGGYVFLHAFALRADMIAGCLLTVALWMGICRPWRIPQIAAITVLVALAFASTIKSVLFAPALLGMTLYRVKSPAHRWALMGTVIAFIGGGVLLLWAWPVLPATGIGAALRDVGRLGQASVARMFSAGLFPQHEWLLQQILRAPVLTVLLLVAPASIIRSGRPAAERMLLLSLLLPLCSVLVYRNAFPYFFAFILPPATIAAAPAVAWLHRRCGVVVPSLLLVGIAVILSLAEDRSVLGRQRTIEAGLHEIFPSPVTYIDDCGFIGDFPRAVNHYASGWAQAAYRSAGVPAYTIAMESEPVPLVLNSVFPLDSLCFDFILRGALLPADEQSISTNYIQHWGDAFVAGKRFPPGEEAVAFQMGIPGTYTVEGGAIVVDGGHYEVGDTLQLSRGGHVAGGKRTATVTLRWGDHLHRPAYPWPSGPVFTQF